MIKKFLEYIKEDLNTIGDKDSIEDLLLPLLDNDWYLDDYTIEVLVPHSANDIESINKIMTHIKVGNHKIWHTFQLTHTKDSYRKEDMDEMNYILNKINKNGQLVIIYSSTGDVLYTNMQDRVTSPLYKHTTKAVIEDGIKYPSNAYLNYIKNENGFEFCCLITDLKDVNIKAIDILKFLNIDGYIVIDGVPYISITRDSLIDILIDRHDRRIPILTGEEYPEIYPDTSWVDMDLLIRYEFNDENIVKITKAIIEDNGGFESFKNEYVSSYLLTYPVTHTINSFLDYVKTDVGKIELSRIVNRIDRNNDLYDIIKDIKFYYAELHSMEEASQYVKNIERVFEYILNDNFKSWKLLNNNEYLIRLEDDFINFVSMQAPKGDSINIVFEEYYDNRYSLDPSSYDSHIDIDSDEFNKLVNGLF